MYRRHSVGVFRKLLTPVNRQRPVLCHNPAMVRSSLSIESGTCAKLHGRSVAIRWAINSGVHIDAGMEEIDSPDSNRSIASRGRTGLSGAPRRTSTRRAIRASDAATMSGSGRFACSNQLETFRASDPGKHGTGRSLGVRQDSIILKKGACGLRCGTVTRWTCRVFWNPTAQANGTSAKVCFAARGLKAPLPARKNVEKTNRTETDRTLHLGRRNVQKKGVNKTRVCFCAPSIAYLARSVFGRETGQFCGSTW